MNRSDPIICSNALTHTPDELLHVIHTYLLVHTVHTYCIGWKCGDTTFPFPPHFKFFPNSNISSPCICYLYIRRTSTEICPSFWFFCVPSTRLPNSFTCSATKKRKQFSIFLFFSFLPWPWPLIISHVSSRLYHTPLIREKNKRERDKTLGKSQHINCKIRSSHSLHSPKFKDNKQQTTMMNHRHSPISAQAHYIYMSCLKHMFVMFLS